MGWAVGALRTGAQMRIITLTVFSTCLYIVGGAGKKCTHNCIVGEGKAPWPVPGHRTVTVRPTG